MAFLAIREIFTECGRIIVTCRAAHSRLRSAVHGDGRERHLAVFGAVTRVAIHESVFRVLEVSADHRGRGLDIVRSARLMTRKTLAGRETAAALHRLMAFEASVVCGIAVRHREINSAPRIMAGDAVVLCMDRVVEPYADGFRGRCLLVTLPTVRKGICAKRALRIVTGRTRIRLVRMHRDLNGRHSVRALRCMTIGAGDAAVPLMAESEPDVRVRIGDTVCGPKLVTGIAGSDVSIVDDLIGCMALKTG